MTNPHKLQKEFIQKLDNMERSKNRTEHFRNFCAMAYYSLSKPTATSKDQADNKERAYMSIVKSYADENDVRVMPELLAMVYRGLNHQACDFLGEIAGEIDALDERTGQFFTPYDVSRFMAKITYGDTFKDTIERNGFVTLSDPCAGAGCMPLAFADEVQAAGYEIDSQVSMQAVDVSQQAFQMCFVQLSMKGIAAEVIHGDTLSCKVYDAAFTPNAIHFINQHGTLFKREEKEKCRNK